MGSMRNGVNSVTFEQLAKWIQMSTEQNEDIVYGKGGSNRGQD
jgi:hypothetical protein